MLATLDIFQSHDVLAGARASSAIIEEGLLALKELPFVSNVRGEKGGMVWGVEITDWNGRTASEIARASVLAAYRGDRDGRGVHIMGPLAGRVLRIAPPLTITEAEARQSVDVLDCSVWTPRLQRTMRSWREGDQVEVEGAVRRRFYRAGQATASRVEVEVSRGRLRRRADAA